MKKPKDTRPDRTRYVNAVRRSFTHDQRISKVGYLGEEVHRLTCPEYQEADRSRDGMTIRAGNFELVFAVLLDDFVDGSVGFPPLHDCLRSTPDPKA